MRTWFPCWLQGTIKSNQERLIGHGGKRPLYPFGVKPCLGLEQACPLPWFSFLVLKNRWFFKNLAKLWLVLYEIPLFHWSFFMALRAGVCHERGNISFSSLLFCFRSADFLSVGLSTCLFSGTSAWVPAQNVIVFTLWVPDMWPEFRPVRRHFETYTHTLLIQCKES